MNCQKCGKENSEASKFCVKCGSAIQMLSHQAEEKPISKGKSVLIRIGVLILIYGGINFVLWGGQELYYRNDTKQMNLLETEMAEEKGIIERTESQLKQEQSILESTEATLTRYKEEGEINLYNSGVDGYNESLESYNTSYSNYESRINEYNSKVDEYNKLVEHSGSRWWLIPIPIPGNHSVPRI